MTVGADVFLDTNILIYAALGQEDEQHRFETARRIVLMEDYCTSSQVLAEFYVNVQKKGTPPLTAERAAEWVRVLARKPCQPVDAEVVRSGVALSRRYQISYWDGAILAAAERLGAHTVYTEDLSHGQSYGSVRVINPFK
ncbi:PIN domain-containing protein [Mangrovibrevibacter kandeliae]|uniref:PIN domain-containing protein n=1 Tax=Mangrovibrevibacter kandeliae TaxID=2968473 RepID=UPI0021177104|nr:MULTISPECIES: PIN domain-containing protein [unclassified Aurantimonas]MCQ8783557.1 PIN domain-containing protein [Aurantimonas sp. CSK15Z-1]MCW4116483.1 PIN domain-containing protein [Aurantimonas sp. MSK8Z-1]